jgi:hypothetical protein
MSNQNYDFDDDFDFEEEDDLGQPPKANSNDLIKQLRKAQRAAEKRAKELESELFGLRSERRESVIKNVLEEKGLSPKIARFIPSDLEPTADALTLWIEENGDVFGLPSQQQTSTPDLATLRQIDAVTAGAVTPDKIENMLLRMDQANSAEEIINMIYSQNQ